ncbi:hypothetical protein Bca101_064451 [Brassica carinata]
MAGVQAGECPYGDSGVSSHSRNSHEKQDEVSRWYFGRKEIDENSPSRLDGVGHEIESEREIIESILLEGSGLSFVVEPGAFEDMCNLRLLKIYSSDPEWRRPGLDLSMGLLYLPYELRLLHWENYSGILAGRV